MVNEFDNNLIDLCNKIAKETGYFNGRIDVQEISSGGTNFSSIIYVVTIIAPQKKDLKLFAKVARLSEALRAISDTLTKSFDTERVFYAEFAIAIEKLYDKYGVKRNDRLYIPKYYGHECTKNKEILVIENLIASGFESFDRFKSFDWGYASAAVAELAKLHAIGIAIKEENFEHFETIQMEKDLFAIPNMKEVFIRQAKKMGSEIIKEEYRDRVQKYLNDEIMLHDLGFLWKPLDGGFLIHSDYKPNNLMHRKKNGKVEIVPVDYQTLYCGRLVADLISFIWYGSDSKFRQRHYHQLLEHYYSELTIALRNLHIDINASYPRKTFEKELEDSKTLGLMLGLGMMPVIMIEPENAPKLESFECFSVAPSQLAVVKMNEVVEDYIRPLVQKRDKCLSDSRTEGSVQIRQVIVKSSASRALN